MAENLNFCYGIGGRKSHHYLQEIMLHIKQLAVTVENSSILTNLSLSIGSGTTHAIMGPNGSGKSSLAYTIAGHPHYAITAGTISFENTELNNLSPDRRAQLGIYLSLQQPPIIPGLSVFTLIKESWRAIKKQQPDLEQLQKQALGCLALLGLPEQFLYRNVHEGFSGGEKKRLEMVIALMLEPKLLILDEIDSGLDVDALRLVSYAIDHARTINPQLSILLITHYQRILDYIHPDYVHILCDGTLATSGSFKLVKHIEQRGYDAFRKSNQ